MKTDIMRQLVITAAISLLCCFGSLLVAQPQVSQPKKNRVWADIGYVYPILGVIVGQYVYERSLWRNSDYGLEVNLKAGLGSFGGLWGGYLCWGGGAGVVLGRTRNKFEFNLGGLRPQFLLDPFYDRSPFIQNRDETDIRFWPLAEIGYRYEPPEGGFIARIKIGTAGIGGGVGWAF